MSIERFRQRKRQEEEYRPVPQPENPYDRSRRVPDRLVPIDPDEDEDDKNEVS